MDRDPDPDSRPFGLAPKDPVEREGKSAWRGLLATCLAAVSAAVLLSGVYFWRAQRMPTASELRARWETESGAPETGPSAHKVEAAYAASDFRRDDSVSLIRKGAAGDADERAEKPAKPRRAKGRKRKRRKRAPRPRLRPMKSIKELLPPSPAPMFFPNQSGTEQTGEQQPQQETAETTVERSESGSEEERRRRSRPGDGQERRTLASRSASRTSYGAGRTETHGPSGGSQASGGGCPAMGGRVVPRVTSYMAQPRVHHDLNTAQIERKSGFGRRGNTRHPGYTEFMRRLGSRPIVASIAHGDGYCVWVKDLSVHFNMDPVDIYASSEYPRGSCGYGVIMTHERKHVSIERRLHSQYTATLRRELNQWTGLPTPDRPMPAGSQAQGRATIEAKIDGFIKSFERRYEARRRVKQAVIDRPDYNRREWAPCKE